MTLLQDFLACIFLAFLGLTAAWMFVTGQLPENV